MDIDFLVIGEIDVSDVCDYTTDHTHLFVLNADKVTIYDYDLKYVNTLPLIKNTANPVRIAVDHLYLYIGYTDGTIEIRIKEEKYDLLRITSNKDAGGPGNARITNLAPTPHYLLVQTTENGVLIYIQPSVLFYKWIMIGSHTTVVQLSIHHQHLYVLMENSEVHFLDFDEHKIIECPAMSYLYVDLTYDGEYLYLATPTSILRVDPKNRYRTNWQYNLQNHKINQLIRVDDRIICFLDKQAILMIGIAESPVTKLIEKIDLHPDMLDIIAEKFKYSPFREDANQNNTDGLAIPVMHENRIILIDLQIRR